MPPLTLDYCFGFIELRLGCLILGCLELIGDIALIAMVIKTLIAKSLLEATFDAMMEGMMKDPMMKDAMMKDANMKDSMTEGIKTIKDEMMKNPMLNYLFVKDQNEYTMRIAVSSIMLVIFFLALAFTFVLIVGVLQKKRSFIKAHLIFRCIFLALGGCIGNKLALDVVPEFLITSILVIILGAYSLLVVRSYFYKINDESNKPIIINEA